jgi:hypothetical protein
MRPFSEFHTDLDSSGIEAAHAAKERSLALWAYLLLRPGMEFVRQRSNFILGWQAAAQAGSTLGSGVSAGAVGSADRPPLGSWMILPNLTTPATQTVLPSNDALYGAAHLELDRQGALVVTVPANVDDRYFSVAVMDAHLNNVAHIGPRWTGNGATSVVLVPPGWDGVVPDGLKVIACPTVSIGLYNRMLVGFEPGDLDRVRAWQAALRISPLATWPDVDAVPDAVAVSDLVHPEINTLTNAREYLAIGLSHLRRNALVEEASWLSTMVQQAGLDTDSAISSAGEEGIDDATALIDATLTTWPRVNGWMLPDPSLGRPNPDVLRSAAFQQFQIGSNDVEESVYYFVDTDGSGQPLDAGDGREYEVTFRGSEVPRHHDQGYWSLTMYNQFSLLVPNPIDRYATRTTRPGTLLDGEGGVTYVLSAHRPEGVPEANWLPAPSGRFRLGLRLFYPEVDLVRRAWAPPPVLRRH